MQVHLPRWFTKWFPSAVWRMPDREEKVCYLTFDDGPVPMVTPWVLDLLDHYNIKATFFVVGENVKRYPKQYQMLLDRGHAVGNHTYNHLKGLAIASKSYIENVDKAAELIDSNLFRPPYGWLKKIQYFRLKRRYKIVMWDVISCDYNRRLPKEEVLDNVLRFTRPGSIIVFHDSPKALENLYFTLPRAIEALRRDGYSFKKIKL